MGKRSGGNANPAAAYSDNTATSTQQQQSLLTSNSHLLQQMNNSGDTTASYYQQMYPTGGNANGPTIMKYTAYMEPLKTFISRCCMNYRQVEALNELMQAPPQRVEMRYKKE